MTMPVTLGTVADKLPNAPGLAFGLTAQFLIVGTLPLYGVSPGAGAGFGPGGGGDFNLRGLCGPVQPGPERKTAMKLLDVVVWPMVLLGLSPFLLVVLPIAAVAVGVWLVNRARRKKQSAEENDREKEKP